MRQESDRSGVSLSVVDVVSPTVRTARSTHTCTPLISRMSVAPPAVTSLTRILRRYANTPRPTTAHRDRLRPPATSRTTGRSVGTQRPRRSPTTPLRPRATTVDRPGSSATDPTRTIADRRNTTKPEILRQLDRS